MNKQIKYLLSLLAVSFLLTGCGSSGESGTSGNTSSGISSTSSDSGSTSEPTTSSQPQHTHTYSDTWKSNSEGHYHECSVCGEPSEVEAHTFNDWHYIKEPTHEEAGVKQRECTICGYEDSSPVSKLTGFVISLYNEADELIKKYYSDTDGYYSLELPSLPVGSYFNGFYDEEDHPFCITGSVDKNCKVIYRVSNSDKVAVSTQAELRNAIEASVPVIDITNNIEVDSTIYINHSVTLTTSQEVTISRKATFGGDMFVIGIDENGHKSIIDGVQSSLTLETYSGGELTFNGNADVIYADEANPTVVVKGSVLFLTSLSNATIKEGVIFTNNRKTDNDRIFNYGSESDEEYISTPERVGGSCIITVFATLVIDGGYFHHNSVCDTIDKSSVGGAIYTIGETSILSGTFRNNSATYGGVIYTVRPLNISTATFDENLANKYGGAIYLADSQLCDCHFVGENANDIVFINNSSEASGGAIFIALNANLYVVNARFYGNETVSNGGAIACKGVLNSVSTSYENNVCTSKGGAVYAYYGSADGSTPSRYIVFSNCSFTNNTGALGGAVGAGNDNEDITYARHVIMSISGSSFTNNHAVLNPSSKYGHGGCLYITKGSECTLINNTYTSNDAVAYGGVIYANNSAVISASGTNTFTTNSANNGGAVYVTDSAIANIENATFSGNTASTNGGALYVYTSAICTLNKVTGSGNEATNFGGFAYQSGASTLTMYSITSTSNSATSGGFVYVTTTGSRLIIYSGSSTGCSATTVGSENLFSNTNKCTIYITGKADKSAFNYDGTLVYENGKYTLKDTSEL